MDTGVPQTPFIGFAPPPHTWLVGHVPQSMVSPQPLPCMPQAYPCWVHVIGTQPPVPQTFGLAPPHVWPVAHVPQSSVPPHVSLALPQSKPCDAHVCLLHGGAPHTFSVPPPPQVSGAVHVPQSCTLPPAEVAPSHS